jgi:hypothetical protein
VLLLAGEGTIGQAIALERRAHPGASDEMFSRGTQQAGGVVAALVWGLALGAVFAVAYVVVRRRALTAGASAVPWPGPAGPGAEWRASLGLAALAFLTVNLVPFLKYPSNPPGVGDPDTIGRRTALYLLMLAWSVVATGAGWQAARVLARRAMPEHLRLPAVAALYVAVVVLGLAALPGSPDTVDAPATLVWRFRLASIGGLAAYWAVCGTTFGWLVTAASKASPAVTKRG